MHTAQPVILLLAAGKSERWRAAGGRGHKLDTALGDSTVFAHALTRATASGCEVRVAISNATPAPVAAMCRMLGITTLMCCGGMGDVIAQAVRQTFTDTGWLIAPADMPCISKATYAAIARAITHGAGVAAPYCQGQRGHPVGFASNLRADLLALTADTGARALLAQHNAARIEVDDPGILLDIDTPDNLHAAQTLIQQK